MNYNPNYVHHIMLTLFAWPSSPYSAKVRAYLNYRNIPYQELTPSAVTLQRVIKRQVGKIIMPVVRTSDGRYLQDSAAIISELEALYPAKSTSEQTNVLALLKLQGAAKIAASLLELMADEWLILSALHYRWQGPEAKQTQAFIEADFGLCFLPVTDKLPLSLPSWVTRRAGRLVASKMQAHLRRLGLMDDGIVAELRAWTEVVLDSLEATLSQQPFLFGQQPCLADFAVYATPYAHLWRDPGSRYLITERPAVLAWIDRLNAQRGSLVTTLASNSDKPVSQIPLTLQPIFTAQRQVQLPHLAKTTQRLQDYRHQHAKQNLQGQRLPDHLGPVDLQWNQQQSSCLDRTFPLWRLQQLHDVIDDVKSAEHIKEVTWRKALQQVDIDIDSLPPPAGLQRINHQIVFA